MEDEDELALHKSITRYGAGVENTFGLLLIPDDVTINNLGIEPEKAQMMQAREWTVFEVARLLRMPASKLMAKGTQTYASQVQNAIDYVIGCLRTYGHAFEQAIQRDLILAKDTYFVKFRLQELLRGDPAAMAAYYTAMVNGRIMTPSEIRQEIDMNPSEELDALSAQDHRPGSNTGPAQVPAADPASAQASITQGRSALKGMLAVHDNAVRCLRRERAAVEKLAKKHASDVDGWKAGLRDFYSDHAAFVSQTMRISITMARGYSAQHGSEFEANGIVGIDGDAGEAWERYEADELCALALQLKETAA
jgi:Phage portal protein